MGFRSKGGDRPSGSMFRAYNYSDLVRFNRVCGVIRFMFWGLGFGRVWDLGVFWGFGVWRYGVEGLATGGELMFPILSWQFSPSPPGMNSFEGFRVWGLGRVGQHVPTAYSAYFVEAHCSFYDEKACSTSAGQLKGVRHGGGRPLSASQQPREQFNNFRSYLNPEVLTPQTLQTVFCSGSSFEATYLKAY